MSGFNADWYGNPTEVAIGGSGNLFATNELPVDMSRKMWSAFPSLTPVLAILSRIAQSKAKNTRIDWHEEKEIATYVTVATTEASASTSITVLANAKTLVADTLLYNPRTFDLRSVDSTPTTDTAITVTVSQGGTTSAIWNAGDQIEVLLPAIDENDSTQYRNVSVVDDNVFNYIHLAKLQYSITRVGDKLTTWFGGPGSKRNQLKGQKFKEFRTKLEKTIYFGGRATSGTAPATKNMMGGFVHYLRNGTLYKDFNGIFTETGFRNLLSNYKDQNPDSMSVTVFCAGNVIDHALGWGLQTIQRNAADTKALGIDVYDYLSRGLKVKLVPLPLLTGPETKGWGWIIDMDRVQLKYLDPPQFHPEAENVGESENIYDTFRSVFSLLLANESRHAMFVGAKL